jgi:hypothetical protein
MSEHEEITPWQVLFHAAVEVAGGELTITHDQFENAKNVEVEPTEDGIRFYIKEDEVA